MGRAAALLRSLAPWRSMQVLLTALSARVSVGAAAQAMQPRGGSRELLQQQADSTIVLVADFSGTPRQSYNSTWCPNGPGMLGQLAPDCELDRQVREVPVSSDSALRFLNVTDSSAPTLTGSYALQPDAVQQLINIIDTTQVRVRLSSRRVC